MSVFSFIKDFAKDYAEDVKDSINDLAHPETIKLGMEPLEKKQISYEGKCPKCNSIIQYDWDE